MKKITKMDTKKILFSFLAVVSVLFVMSTLVSAADTVTNYTVEVNGIAADGGDISVVAGDTITVEVFFTADVSASNVRMKAEIQGNKFDAEARTGLFDIEAGAKYTKVVTLKVPSDLNHEVSTVYDLDVRVWNGDHRTDLDTITLRVQRPSYQSDIKAINAPRTVDAGDQFPVDVVLENIGYNDLDNVFVTVSIPALDIEQSAFFGDIIALETAQSDDDDHDTVSGRLYLEVPFGTPAGIYAMNVEVTDDDSDTTESATRQLTVKNDFANNIVAMSAQVKSASTNEDTEFKVLVVNPTDQLKVYRFLVDSPGSISTSLSDSTVAVPAGSSQFVTVTANAEKQGSYTFSVETLSGAASVGSTTFTLNVDEGSSTTNTTTVVWTIILIIIFLVLLVVLVVLLTKKPEKSEEFGESYY